MAELMLDTTVFKDFRQGDSGAKDIVDKVIRGELLASVSPLTVYELWGVADLDRRTEIGFAGMLSFMEHATISLEAAKTAGVWLAQIEGSQRGRFQYYSLVAATAMERGESICTRDAEPFRRFYPEIVTY